MNYQETSREAFATTNKTSDSETVFAVIKLFENDGGITCFDIQQITGLIVQTCSARVRGLVLDERVKASGNFGLTDSGRKAIKWIPIRKVAA